MELPRPCDYLGATIPLPVRVIGTRLKPFSLGHYLLLQRLGNAFACGNVATIADLLQAIVVCSRDYKDALVALDTWRGIWHQRLLKLRVLVSRVTWVECVKAFRDYMDNGSKTPSFLPKQESGTRVAAPLPILVKVVLQSRLNYTPEQALNAPWGMALHEYGIHLAIEGKLDLVDEQVVSDLELASRPLQPDEQAALVAALSKVNRGA